jgi:hypothetical protein
MTIAAVLRKAGIEFEEWGIDKFSGTTPGGKGWTMYRAAGAYGLKFTLYIEGMNPATACLLRTAIQKIKKN